MSVAQNPAPQSSYYQILKVNLHSHTNYSDGTYNPSELVDLYKNAGYDVLGITDHNTVAGYEEALAEAEKVGLIVICGEEVTCSWSDGSWKHVLSLFNNESVNGVEGSDREVRAIFDAIHTQNGIGIIAHPWYSWNKWQTYANETYIDGWEVDYSMNWILQSNYIYLLGHDFHNASFVELLPNYFTYVLAQNRTEAGVKEALMQRRIVVYGDGNLYGSAYAIGLYFENLATPSPTDSKPTPTATPSSTLVPQPLPTSSTSPSPYPANLPTPSPELGGDSTFIFPLSPLFVGSFFGLVGAIIVVLLFLKKGSKSNGSNRKL